MLLQPPNPLRTRPPVRCAWDAGCTLGEGPVWDTYRQRLLFVDIKGDALLSFDERRGGSVTSYPGMPSAVVPLQASDDLLAVSRSGLEVVSPLRRTRTRISAIEENLPGNRPNDGKCDRQGRLWFGTADDAEASFSGSLYRVGADGGMTRMLTGIGVSNGLDWSPDGTVFYYTDSMRRTIWRFPFDPVEGTLGERSVFVALGAESGNPDGLTVDEEGFVWCAVWDGSRIIRFGPGGSIDRLVEMPVPRPTSLCFGGPDLSILYVTSARIGLSPDALAAAPLSGALFAVETGVRGLPSRPAVLK